VRRTRCPKAWQKFYQGREMGDGEGKKGKGNTLSFEGSGLNERKRKLVGKGERYSKSEKKKAGTVTRLFTQKKSTSTPLPGKKRKEDELNSRHHEKKGVFRVRNNLYRGKGGRSNLRILRTGEEEVKRSHHKRTVKGGENQKGKNKHSTGMPKSSTSKRRECFASADQEKKALSRQSEHMQRY